MKICVIGTGYVGLVAGTGFAETGNDVVCVDVDREKIDALNKGLIPIFEPGLSHMVARNIEDGRLTFTTDLAAAVKKSTVIFISVGTPQGDDGSADLKYVLGVAREIAEAMNGYKVIVIKSTVPVGTNVKVRAVLDEAGCAEFDMVSNPEFLKEGHAVEDFMRPDRVVVGCDSDKSGRIMEELYSPFVRTGKPIIRMGITSAELTKYAANGLLATRITFMNQVANLADRLGVNVADVRRGMGSDSRIGPAFLFPGVGYGGSCFPKDVRALINTARDADCGFDILEAVDKVNNAQKLVLFEKLHAYYKGELAGRCVAVWGLAFKPRTDDVREAPALVLIRKLLEAGVKVSAFDPEAVETARAELGGDVEYAENAYAALEGAEALILATEWNEFRRPDFERMKKLMKKPVIFDGRNIYTRASVEEAGFDYFGIGV